MKRTMRLGLLMVLLVACIGLLPKHTVNAEDYRSWAQGDARWSGIHLGGSSATVGSEGCLVTSVTKLIIQSGLRDAGSFNVASLVNGLNSRNGFTSGGALYYGKPGEVVSGFNNYGTLVEYGSHSSAGYNAQILSWINAGYHMAIAVNGRGHWVAVDEARSKATGQIYIMDSLRTAQNAEVPLSSRYAVFNEIHAWTGGRTPGASSGGNTIPSTNVPYNPEGYLDEVVGGNGTVRVRGWAFDRNALESALEIHVYVGGPYNAAAYGDNTTRANVYRPDVNNVFSGVGNYHGFDSTIKVPVTGQYEVYVYAINVGPHVGNNYNTFLGKKTVTITRDTEAPKITDIKVSNISSTGYTVSCKVTDNVKLDRVQFPTWTLYRGQDDLAPSWVTSVRCRGTISGNTVTFRVNTSEHNNETGTYRTHIYAWDTSGNRRSVAVADVNVPKKVTSAVKKSNQVISANSVIKNAGDKTFSIGARLTKGNGRLTYTSNNTKVATISSGGKVTIKGIGIATITIKAAATSKYNAASKKVTVTVRPKGTSIQKLQKKSSKILKISWKRNSSASGYQIQYATNSKFSGAKTVTIRSNWTLSKTLSVQKGKTYYVRIRTYKGALSSSWSAVKKIKM